MRKVLRYLRIAFSVTCGILCLLLIALWVRSYRSHDALAWRVFGDRYVSARSNRGHLVIATSDYWGPNAGTWKRFVFSNVSEDLDAEHRVWDYSFDWWPALLAYVSVPHWFAVVITAALAAAPWLRWRYSLRTLLIAMTLVAVVLGAIAYAMR